MLNGNTLVLHIGDNRVEAIINTLSYAHNPLEVTMSKTMGWSESIPERKTYEMTFTTLETIRYEWIGNRVGFRLSLAGISYVGHGYLESITESGSTDKSIATSGTITSDGELTTVIPTVNQSICFDGVPICFDSMEIDGPLIDLNI